MKFVSITKKVIADCEMVTKLTFEKSDQASLDFIVNGLISKGYTVAANTSDRLMLESENGDKLFNINHKTGVIKYWVFREIK